MTDRFLNIQQVLDRVGASRSSVYAWMNLGLFPRSRQLGPRRKAWLESEIASWIENRQ